MSPKMFGFFLVLFVAMTFLGAAITGSAYEVIRDGGGNIYCHVRDCPTVNAVNLLMQGDIITFHEVPVFDWRVPAPNFSYVVALFNVGTWNFPFFEGNMQVIRLLLLLPITGALVWGAFTTLTPIIANAVRAIKPFG